ncbi:TIGR02757 family protein [Salibacter sp.]|uniref:TIGR02757 family protein n=1 Tax=Salibacter sp. TaxID=2010995 RepID=UPI0028709807|nr:TIGR02757 family protein [Salibacter sp.]MDR9399080.1 TIGR02757 family protein [Salibacter sp.]MDR9488587.1 TIGR02757 family protein [Salibacter sp.]
MTRAELKEFLDEKADFYEQNWFIESDPISIPHRFSKKEDIEIAGFLSATIAWGQRKTIINNANKLMKLMDESPHDFVMNASGKELQPLESFVHRTFNGSDLLFFIEGLKKLYENHGGLEGTLGNPKIPTVKERISDFKRKFFEPEHLKRTQKHVSDPMKGSSAKRLNMFLRWMVRSPEKGVDFGIWENLSPKNLMLPLDVHTATQGRNFKLLKRKQNDWKAVEEITKSLQKLDLTDPVKYDFALFGIGAHENSILNNR